MLTRTFGRDYQDYCRSVPRWIQRLRPADHSDQRSRAMVAEFHSLRPWTRR